LLVHGQLLPSLHQDIWQHWNWNPTFILVLGLVIWAYLRGVQKVWLRAGVGQVIGRWQPAAFILGLATLFIALNSPLDAWATALFSAHMLQHLLLILVAAPLLVSGAPLVPLLWALPKRVRQEIASYWNRISIIQKLWHGLNQPLLVWFLYAVILWLWHLPYLYQLALTQDWVHQLEHITFLGAALLWWWVVIQPTGYRRYKRGSNILLIFTTALHGGALGALITFARVPLYPVYAPTVAAWELTLLEDQQLAGLVMWIPSSVVYVVTAVTLFLSWLAALEQKMGQTEEKLRKKLLISKEM
jgi:putative membrane protein